MGARLTLSRCASRACICFKALPHPGDGVSALQVLLDEAWTEVNVDLYQRRVPNGLEAMDLAGLNDKDISRAALEGLAVDRPQSPPFTDELNLVIRVPVRPRSRTRLPMEQEQRNAGVALLSSNKLMRTANKRQILLAHVMHPLPPSYPDWMSVATIRFRGELRTARGRYRARSQNAASSRRGLSLFSGGTGWGSPYRAGEGY